MKTSIEKVKILQQHYNEVPYISKTFPSTHPRIMSTITGLYGFEAPDLKNARVLEIGCSFGGNITPLAITYPEAEFVGLDLAEVQIKEGQKLIERFGLENIKLERMNILDYNDQFGKFDYIICHGVFSWVPKVVQEKILEVVKNGLTENGLATISYNTNPGWKDLSIARDIMLWNQRNLNKNGNNVNGADIVNYGKKNIEFLKEYSALEKGTKRKLEMILEKSSHYLYHEYYEEFNEAFYLYQFQDMLLKHGLSHVSDTDLEKTLPIHWEKSDEVEDMLSEMSLDSPVVKEQYYDYLYNRQFRISIVSHLDTKADIDIQRNVKKKNLEKLYYRAAIFKNKESGKYRTPDDKEIVEVYAPILEVLENEYPKFISGEDLLKRPEIVNDEAKHAKLLDLLYRKCVYTSSYNFGIEDKKVVKLSDKWRKYIEYFIEEENPIISLSTGTGELLSVDKFIMKVLLQFDGRTDEELFNHFLEEKERGQILVSGETEEEKQTELRNFLNELKQIILASCYAE